MKLRFAFFAALCGLVSAAAPTDAPVENALDFGDLTLRARKAPVFARLAGREWRDGRLLLNYRPADPRVVVEASYAPPKFRLSVTMPEGGDAPRDLMLELKPAPGVEILPAGTRSWEQLYRTSIPTLTDRKDISVRPYRLADGSTLCAVLTGNERWGNGRREHLALAGTPAGGYRGELEFVREIPFRNPDEPLRYARAYSLEIDENGCGTDGFFPLGVLGESFERGFAPYIGGNYRTHSFDPNAIFSTNRQGVFGVSIWAVLRQHANKKLAKSMDDQGNPHRHVCLFDPDVRRKVFDFARASVQNAVRQNDAAIFKWEIDNEYIPPLDYSPPAVDAFRKWLETAYAGDVARWRQAWKIEAAGFADAVPPKLDEFETKPAAFLDWSRFQQETFAAFLGEYYRTIYEADPRHRGVNGKDTQSSLEMQRIARTRRSNHELIGRAVAPYTNGVRGMDHYGHDDRNSYELNYYYHTIAPVGVRPGRRVGMLYGENNNHNGPGWQFAQTVWRIPANGYRGGNFFCSGWFGAWGDWASFGFTTPDGTRRDKFYYLPLFFSMIHRSERFLTQAAIPPETPKVAILFAQRDVPFGVDDNITPWGFPINSRLRLYTHLRNAGFFVQVIPYGKLVPEYLKDVQAVFLVSAEHLTETELARLREYVSAGGRIVADTRAGMFDEHHLRHADGLSSLLGIRLKGRWNSPDVTVDPGDVWFPSRYGNVVRADGRINFELAGARVLNADFARSFDNKAGLLTLHRYGRGHAVWTNTQLGTIRSESAPDEVPARDFFRDLLKATGLEPAYTLTPDLTTQFRAETPMVDGRGNAAIAVANRTYRELPPTRLALRAPVEFDHAFLGLAEEYVLRPLPFRKLPDGRTEFSLPALKSGGMIYLMPNHPPMLGIAVNRSAHSVKVDPYTAEFRPGDRFRATVQLVNPARTPLPPGQLVLHALTGWTVSAPQDTAELAPGGMAEYTFDVAVPSRDAELIPNFVYPLTADFIRDGKRLAVTHAVVALDLPSEGREYLLTDNWSKDNYPWAIPTGADYRYLTTPDEARQQSIADPVHTVYADNRALHALLSGDRPGRHKSAEFRNLTPVEAEFDLKKSYGLTRALIRRGRTPLDTAPLKVTLQISTDGKNWSEPAAFDPDWHGMYADFRLPRPTDGRWVRVRFDFPEAGGSVDEVWLFGRQSGVRPAPAP